MAEWREFHFSGNPEDFENMKDEFFRNSGFGGGRRQRFDRKEFLRKYLGKGYVDDLDRGKFGSIIWQCYRTGVPDSWLPITKEDLKNDTGAEPKFFNKTFFYVQMENGGDYIINESPAILIFYDHIKNIFVYIRKDGGVVTEDKCIESYDEAYNKIINMHKNVGGKIRYIIDSNGNKFEYKGKQFGEKEKSEEN